jgi:uncharacterized protein (TIGR03067 family)
MSSIIVALALCGLAPTLVLACAVRADDRKKSPIDTQPADLVGRYQIVSGEKFGLEEPKERIERTTVNLSRDRVVVSDKDQKEVYAATYTLDTKTKPWKITMVSKLPDSEQTAVGLIEKQGKTVRLIYALPGGTTPTEFRTQDKQLMFTMTEVSDDTAE